MARWALPAASASPRPWCPRAHIPHPKPRPICLRSRTNTPLEKGRPGAVYNIGGEAERCNIDIVKAILKLLSKPEKLIRFVADRPGHDRRYAMNAGKIREELGWVPAHTFERGLEETVQWYVEHQTWWERVMSGAYREYYEAQYRTRLQAALS